MSINFIELISAPIITFLAFVIVAFWIRKKLLEKVLLRFKWVSKKDIYEIVKEFIFFAIIIIGAFVTIELWFPGNKFYFYSKKILLSLFFVLVLQSLHRLAIVSFQFFQLRLKNNSQKVITNLKKISFVTCFVLGIFIIFEIWNLPTTPFLLLMLAGIGGLFLFFKEDFSNIISWFYLNLSETLKKGDYIKLETGEEGEIKNITLLFTEILSSNGKKILLPNSKISNVKIEIFRKPPPKASNPFRFYTRLNIKELTGLKARNLKELLECIKTAEDSSIFFHTHDFIEEYHYLNPPPSNEFALWIRTSLNNPLLAEKLSNIDIFEFPTIGALRNRLVSIIEEHINLYGIGDNSKEGNEFHFIKSVSTIAPTSYVAHNLLEFVENLKFISHNSLFFHVYEAKLRLGKVSNDFSVWINENLGDKILAEKIICIDPYMYSIEGLRSKVIEVIEKHLQGEIKVV